MLEKFVKNDFTTQKILICTNKINVKSKENDYVTVNGFNFTVFQIM
jgi:hypothetical protein